MKSGPQHGIFSFYNFHHQLSGTHGIQHFLPHRLVLDLICKLFGNLIVHVRIHQGAADFLYGISNIELGDACLPLNILEGGFLFGGSYGDGVLFEGGRVTGYYNSAAASFGLQAGVDKVGYAMFFMAPSDMTYLHKSEGWELGVSHNVTLVDEGVAGSFSSSTARKGVYAFFFEQRGLLAGTSLKGTKITKIEG